MTKFLTLTLSLFLSSFLMAQEIECTYVMDKDSNATITLSDNQSLCIMPGVEFHGRIIIDGKDAQIYNKGIFAPRSFTLKCNDRFLFVNEDSVYLNDGLTTLGTYINHGIFYIYGSFIDTTDCESSSFVNNGIMTVTGDFNSSITFKNKGSLTIEGDFDNLTDESDFLTNSGNISVAGSLAQRNLFNSWDLILVH